MRVSTAALDIVQDGCAHWQVRQSFSVGGAESAQDPRQATRAGATESHALEWMSIDLVSSALRRLESLSGVMSTSLTRISGGME